MQSKILDSSYIIDFTNEGFNLESINKQLKVETDEILHSFKDETLRDWDVHFVFIFNNTRSLLIYRNAGSYPIEKYKEIVIHIPIPSSGTVPWGVKDDQYIQKIDHLDKKLKNFDVINVDYMQYKNREEYVFDCMRRAIKFCFENGFTISGVRVKLPVG